MWFQKVSILPTPPPTEGHWKFLGGSHKPNLWKRSMKLNWNFLWVEGVKMKNLPWGGGGGMNILWNYIIPHITIIVISLLCLYHPAECKNYSWQSTKYPKDSGRCQVLLKALFVYYYESFLPWPTAPEM